MQGSNNSRIGMNNSRKGFDDDSWGYGKKNTRGNKGRNSQKQEIRTNRRATSNVKQNMSYEDEYA